MPLSNDPAKRQRQIQNLKKGRHGPPPTPEKGNRRTLKHGRHATSKTLPIEEAAQGDRGGAC